MQVQPIQSFQQQNDTVSKPSVRQYNIALIKFYFRNSPISIFTFIIMCSMFIICTIMTYVKNENSHQKYSVTHFNPLVLVKLGANAGFMVKYGEIYRLVTAIFLHGGLVHFIINSFSIFGLLMPVQQQFKWKNFLAAFFIGGVQGNLVSCMANFLNGNENIIAVGASTSICAILGLYLATLYVISLKHGNVQATKKKIAFMVVYLFLISMIPGVDFYGHFGSFISGALIGLSFSALKRDYIEDSLSIKKMKLVALILLTNYSLLLLSLFLI